MNRFRAKPNFAQVNALLRRGRRWSTFAPVARGGQYCLHQLRRARKIVPCLLFAAADRDREAAHLSHLFNLATCLQGPQRGTLPNNLDWSSSWCCAGWQPWSLSSLRSSFAPGGCSRHPLVVDLDVSARRPNGRPEDQDFADDEGLAVSGRTLELV